MPTCILINVSFLGVEPMKFKQGFNENTEIHEPAFKEIFSESSNISKDASLKSMQEVKNNTLISNVTINSHTSEPGKIIQNITNNMSTLDPSSTAKDFTYNTTPDILPQSGDLIMFLALNANGSLNESIESVGSTLLTEGSVVALEEIESTGKELITVFEKIQNLTQSELPALQLNIKDESNISDIANEDNLKVSIFVFNHSRENQMEEISTKNTSVLSDNAEYSTDMYGVQNIELNFMHSYKDGKLNETFNEDPVKQLTDHSSKIQTVESEEMQVLNEGTEVALREISSNEDDFVKIFKTNHNIIPTDLRTLHRSQKHKINSTESTSEIDLDASTFTFNYIGEIEHQKMSTTKLSDIDDNINTDRFETVNDKLDSFQHIEPAESSNIGPKLPKCPDPGLCIFWFLAQDLCAEDSHCHGALLCCMWGCSKICVEGENISA